MIEDRASRPRLGVLGAGTMGSGIALAALYRSMEVALFDVSQEALTQAGEYIATNLARKDLQEELHRLRSVGRLEDLAASTIVVEAVTEDLYVKQDLFKRLDAVCPPPTILATNTSSLSVTAIAAATTSPERVGGMHFFNPPAVLPLVEVVRGGATSDATVKALMRLAERLGKVPVLTQDTPGFIVNRVARPFYGEALRLLGEGVAGHEAIDRIVERGAGFKMGPFRLMDLIGIDINLATTRSLYERSFGEPRYRPHWIQQQKVTQNALGRKSGHGFYRYDEGYSEPDPPPEVEPGTRSGLMILSTGSWAPGMAELLSRAGYSLSETHGGRPLAAWIAAGRQEGLREQIRRYDRGLPEQVPLLCQAADVTLSEISSWIKQPERLVGFDGLFLSQGSVATLIGTPMLRDETRQTVDALMLHLGRQPIWIEDSPGLVLPRLVCSLANEGAFAVGEGVADAETIDKAMQLGVRFPHGPLAWANRLGHGRVIRVLEHLQAEYGEERYRVAPNLRRWSRLGVHRR